MERFARLYDELDATTRTSEKLAALERYFREAPPADAAWALFFLSGGRLKRAVNATLLRDLAAEVSGFPAWMLDECYSAVGDLSETIALIVPPHPTGTSLALHEVVQRWLLPLQRAGEAEKRRILPEVWAQTDARQRLAFHKLISGTFRVGAARRLVVRALAAVASERAPGQPPLDPAVMEHRLLGSWEPTPEGFTSLITPGDGDAARDRLFPFCLASQLNENPAQVLGDISAWQLEYKWDGTRAQLIRRHDGAAMIWSRGEELVTHQFPEVAAAALLLDPGTVLDGEILLWQGPEFSEGGRPRPFSELQRRLGRKDPVAAGLVPGAERPGPGTSGHGEGQLRLFGDRAERPGRPRRRGASGLGAGTGAPARGVVFMAYDVLQHHGADVRQLALAERRLLLERVLSGARARHAGSGLPGEPALRLSPVAPAASWEEAAALRTAARRLGVEGLMLKPRESVYGVGRARSGPGGAGWWKWKIDPFSVDAVLLYAQPGTGKRASIYSDQTFALWSDGPSAPARELVPFAKAYSGLTDEELRRVDSFVRRNTVQKHGPVRMVRPALVFEIAFEDIRPSTRHRSGIAVRFPRIARWRQDKEPEEADTLAALRELLRAREAALEARS
ncbi:MAG TPA: ATP-dependent DNA ligase [Phycisphaerales bacterium]|nr:ATP-dependent DNA ligase [Phycisphaerales bacterium]